MEEIVEGILMEGSGKFVLNSASQLVEFKAIKNSLDGNVEQLPKNVANVIIDLINEFGMFVFTRRNEPFLSLMELMPKFNDKPFTTAKKMDDCISNWA